MTCSLEVPTNIEVTNLTFKDNEVTIGNNPLYLNSLNKIQFTYNTQTNSTEPKPSSTGQIMYNRKKSNSHKAAVIVVSVIAGVVVLGGLIAAILYFSKLKSPGGSVNATNLQNTTDKVKIDSIRNDTNPTNIDMMK